MEKLVEINVVCNGSTGKIMKDIAEYAGKRKYETYCFFGRGNKNNNINCIKIGNALSVYLHLFLARLGFNGHGSYFATKKMLKQIKRINPNVIHLHNIHGYYINFKLLFNYLKKDYHGKVVWTLHDCWAFTGHCAYFSAIKCNKWQKECFNCPQLKAYPKEIFDTTKREYLMKKELFCGVKNMILLTPSNWLKGLIRKSFLKDYEVRVINNGIDINVFKPTYDEYIYKKYHIPKDKKIILGVANIWEKRKGLDVFIDLAKIIKKDELIVLIGLNEKQMQGLPNNVMGIKRTENLRELVIFYTIASVFVNPSQEESFSMVTAEALACYTPVIVYSLTAPKELINQKCGIVVNNNNYMDYYKAYQKIVQRKINEADFKIFDKRNMAYEIIKIYEEKR